MNKRQFVLAGALGALALPSAGAPGAKRSGPVLLTVTGAISRGNRGPLNPALDQLMVKHGVSFTQAWAFDAAMLARLPSVRIRPTLEYDAQPHELSGPLLTTVLDAAGASTGAASLVLRALDGYTVALTPAQARANRTIVATSLDGQPMSLGGLGPLWAVHDADRLPELKDKPLKDRYALCPWGLYHIDVKAG